MQDAGGGGVGGIANLGYRIRSLDCFAFFSQRRCGRARPPACLENAGGMQVWVVWVWGTEWRVIASRRRSNPASSAGNPLDRFVTLLLAMTIVTTNGLLTMRKNKSGTIWGMATLLARGSERSIRWQSRRRSSDFKLLPAASYCAARYRKYHFIAMG